MFKNLRDKVPKVSQITCFADGNKTGRVSFYKLCMALSKYGRIQLNVNIG